PHTWSRQFPLAAGSLQSPVHIQSQRAVYSPELAARPLTLRQPPLAGCRLSNTGVGFQVSAAADHVGTAAAQIEGGPLEAVHDFAQFHMHWGACDTSGSEHVLNGRLYPAELHLVHWCRGSHASFDAAASASSGDRLAVLAVFVEVGRANQELAQILDNFGDIREAGSTDVTLTAPVNLSALMPSSANDYFTYAGSLTTPPCFESVRWIVFKEPISVSREQALRSLESNRGSQPGKAVDNFRHLMPLGRRELLASQPLSNSGSE
uniref:Carbonic anhydrase n=1 Tax=Macrostomum lignano TaxID=282301 RepID=A0A1I8ITJ3_9PLAT